MLVSEILGDGTLADAGRLMNISEADMRAKLAALVARGFPQPDATTGMIDLDAVVQWRRLRHPSLFDLIGHQPGAQDARNVVSDRIKGMFANAKAGR
ncbi:MAG TPA: hypothetical protein VGN82_14450 [Bosea sp. (in: a-proteobacteria)]|uniref:hypothetical protein n=1 Tax=Bosea sp. (in: a-proteobacteria) TaxID=1871050 RepID=UPI002E11227C|nr:hypothetical protein [Bosea sp. (in: a-proteobacteria)]